MAVTHFLSCVVRFNDHFTGAAVPDELPVRLDGSFQRPAASSGGSRRRQSDGTYRFVGAPGGAARILWRDPFTRDHLGWTRWEEDPEIVLPLAEPAAMLAFDLWPTADATAPSGATGVRGRLVGPDAAGQDVRIAMQGEPFDRFTRSDEHGNFLFLPPGRLALDASGRVALTIAVSTPGGGPRIVNGGNFLPGGAGPDFGAADFTIAPRTVPRVLFRLA